MRTTSLALLALVAPALSIAPQPEGPDHTASPHAEPADSGIAALSAREVEQLRDGAGMGMARAAELNHYPGPRHVLELAGELGLSTDQRAAVEAAHDAMKAEAMRLGAEILGLEEHLQRRFAHRHIDEASLREATAEIARLQGELRLTHLAAHLKTSELLTAEQIARYDLLRGYR